MLWFISDDHCEDNRWNEGDNELVSEDITKRFLNTKNEALMQGICLQCAGNIRYRDKEKHFQTPSRETQHRLRVVRPTCALSSQTILP